MQKPGIQNPTWKSGVVLFRLELGNDHSLNLVTLRNDHNSTFQENGCPSYPIVSQLMGDASSVDRGLTIIPHLVCLKSGTTSKQMFVAWASQSVVFRIPAI